jgi:hypothetical protein
LTKPKYPAHRIGFRDRNDDLARSHYLRTDEDVVEDAQWIFLLTVAREVPDVIDSLTQIPPGVAPEQPDANLLDEWANQWNIRDDWCRAYARAAWRFWQDYPAAQRTYWVARDDGAGKLVADDQNTFSALRPLKDPEHFRWLVRAEVLGESWSALARSARRDVRAVQTACRILAELIGLTLRPRSRGRPSSSDPAGQ